MIDTEAVQHFPLQRAVICIDCESVTNAMHDCPACGGTSLLSLSRVLNRTEIEGEPLDPEAARVLHQNLWDLYDEVEK